jgi:AAR2 C-terminal repeat region/AAR2 N-terminal domain
MASTLVLAGVPPGAKVGIGMREWTAQERFRGIRDVPPGVFFIFVSHHGTEKKAPAGVGTRNADSSGELQDESRHAHGTGPGTGIPAPRSGFFAVFQAQTVVARAFDHESEDFLSLEEIDAQLGRLDNPGSDQSKFGIAAAVDGLNITGGDDDSQMRRARRRERWQSLRDELYELIQGAHEGSLGLWGLGPFPMDDLETWISLTSFITPRVVLRLGPGANGEGSISSVYDTDDDVYGPSSDEPGSVSARQQRRDRRISDAEAALEAQLRAGASDEELQASNGMRQAHQPNFSYVSAQHPPRGLSREEVTEFGVDKTVSLEAVIRDGWRGDEAGVLGELQFSFICFLVGQSFDGFEQWKKLVIVICGCQAAVSRRPQFFAHAVQVLAAQLKHVPLEFFGVDEVFDGSKKDSESGNIARNSFLANSLRELLEVLEDDDAGEHLNRSAAGLRGLVEWKFGKEILQPRRGHTLFEATPREKYRVEELCSSTNADGETDVSTTDFFDSDDDFAPAVVNMDDLSDGQRQFLKEQWAGE